jgi:hypothetical protein
MHKRLINGSRKYAKCTKTFVEIDVDF